MWKRRGGKEEEVEEKVEKIRKCPKKKKGGRKEGNNIKHRMFRGEEGAIGHRQKGGKERESDREGASGPG